MEFDVMKIPSNVSDYYAWADYIELACLVSFEGRQTKSDILDRIGISKSLYKSSTDDGEDDFKSQKMKDRWESRISDYYLQFPYRFDAFKDYYPFELSDDNNSISLISELDEKHKLYILLLISFNLRYFSRKEIQLLTRCFELLSSEALKMMLPSQSQVFVYGTAAGNNPRYTGDPFAKAKLLAAELCEVPMPDATEENFSAAGGDSGLDLVAFIGFPDKNSGRLIMFGQCACSQEDWVEKQSSSSFDIWRHRLTFKSPPVNMIFIPGLYRKSDGSWHNPTKIFSILIDRLRLVDLLKGRNNVLDQLPLGTLLTDVLAYKEEVA